MLRIRLLLMSPLASQRARGVWKLQRLGTPQAMALMLKLLRRQENTLVKTTVEAWPHLGDRGGRPIAEALVDGDDLLYTRALAVVENACPCYRTGSHYLRFREALREELARLLSDRDEATRDELAAALIDAGCYREGVAAGPAPGTILALGEALLRQGGNDAREALISLGAAAIPACARLLARDASARSTMTMIFQAIADRDKPGALAPRWAELLGHEDQKVRSLAREFLGKVRGPEVGRALLDEIERAQGPARAAKLEALKSVGPVEKEAIPRLSRLLTDPTARRGALELLGKTGGPEAARCILEALATDKGEAREAAIHALARLSRYGPESVPALLNLLDDSEARHAAIQCLSRAPEHCRHEVTTALLRVLHGRRDRDTTAAIIQTLGHIGGPTLLAGLVDLAAREPSLGVAVAEASARMKGRFLPRSTEQGMTLEALERLAKQGDDATRRAVFSTVADHHRHWKSPEAERILELALVDPRADIRLTAATHHAERSRFPYDDVVALPDGLQLGQDFGRAGSSPTRKPRVVPTNVPATARGLAELLFDPDERTRHQVAMLIARLGWIPSDPRQRGRLQELLKLVGKPNLDPGAFPGPNRRGESGCRYCNGHGHHVSLDTESLAYERHACGDCDGTGQNKSCPQCHGLGTIQREMFPGPYLSFPCVACKGTGRR